ncbi:energy transducer TonB [Mucilaginibacter phyllosphaerae]
MKHLALFIALLLLCLITYSANALNIDTGKTKSVFTAIEHPPIYPGGDGNFGRDVVKNLKYPEVAKLIGINGRIVVSFIVDKDGKMTDITPVNCIGAGCESEAVKAMQSLKIWQPGIQKGKPVRVQYSIPINFAINKGKVKLSDLRSSHYGFLFKLNDSLYTIDEAQNILGKSFQSDRVEIAEPFYNIDSDPKFFMPDKKEVYVIKLKG